LIYTPGNRSGRQRPRSQRTRQTPTFVPFHLVSFLYYVAGNKAASTAERNHNAMQNQYLVLSVGLGLVIARRVVALGISDRRGWGCCSCWAWSTGSIGLASHICIIRWPLILEYEHFTPAYTLKIASTDHALSTQSIVLSGRTGEGEAELEESCGSGQFVHWRV